MLTRKDNHILVQPKDIQSTHEDLEVLGVFNPGAIRSGDEIILLVRVIESSIHKRAGWLHAPRLIPHSATVDYEFDWVELDPEDHDKRKPLMKNGLRRLAYISHLEIVRLTPDGQTVTSIDRHPELFGQNEYETYGIEDPRITEIDDTFYISYVAVSPEMGDCTCLMTTRDFHSFTRHGVIFPWENKDVVFFPDRLNGKYCALTRPLGETKLTRPSIVLAESPDMKAWGNYRSIIQSQIESRWQSAKIGSGTPPLKTERGWLILYHGVNKQSPDDVYGVYSVGALLTDLTNPAKIIAQLKEPILIPETDFEIRGYIPNVVFPTGVVPIFNDTDSILIYYGASDTVTAVMTVSLEQILKTLDQN
jgi:predicted GH43/DUF377 family glycosyl hydrolase